MNRSPSPVLFRSWNDDKVRQLERLWWEGETAESIAVVLNVVNARAVEEKAHREGFRRGRGKKLSIYMHENRRPMQAQPVQIRTRPDEPAPVLRNGAIITMANIGERECRWMGNAPPTSIAQLCGHKAYAPKTRSWCEHHFKRVFPGAA